MWQELCWKNSSELTPQRIIDLGSTMSNTDIKLNQEQHLHRLERFLHDAFAPYGNFPSRSEVTRELLANLVDRYNDFKASGMSDEDAFSSTTQSLGDVDMIMEVQAADIQQTTNNLSLRESLKEAWKQTKQGTSKFAAVELKQNDLNDTVLTTADFSFSDVAGTTFIGSDLTAARFFGTSLKGANFSNSILTSAQFVGSELVEVQFANATLNRACFHGCSMNTTTFRQASLNGTEFKASDLSDANFDGLTLEGTIFNASSLRRTSFRGATLRNVSFHHSDVRHAIFEGTVMDKVTFALLKGAKANLINVVVAG